MNHKEAIDELQSRVDLITNDYKEDKVLSSYKAALTLGVEALESSVPKKPKHIHISSGIRFGRCDRCQGLVNDEWKGCPFCRGAIDWEE